MAENKANEVSETANIETSAKKCNKGLVISIIAVVAVLLIGAACFFGYKYFKGKDPVKLTSDSIRGLSGKIEDVKDNDSEIAKMVEKGGAFETTAKVTAKVQGETMLSLDVKSLSDTKKEYSKVDINGKAMGAAFADLSVVLNKNKAYAKLNDTMNKYYSLDLTEMLDEIAKNSTKETKIDLDYEKLIEYLADALDNSFSKKDFDSEKTEIAIGDKDVKVTKYTTEVDNIKAKKIADEFLKKVVKDEKLLKQISALSDTSVKELKEGINEFIDTKAEKAEGTFNYSIYVTTFGKVVGYGIEAEGVNIVIGFKGDVATITVESQGVTASITFEEISDDHFQIRVNAMGVVNAKLDIKSEEKTIKKGKEYQEKVTISFTLDAMGEKMDASLEAVSNIKKVDSVKVDESELTGAIDVASMTSSQTITLQSEIDRSSLGRFYKSLTGERLSSIFDSNAIETKTYSGLSL